MTAESEEEMDPLHRWHESERRSRERRGRPAPGRSRALPVALALAAAVGAVTVAMPSDARRKPPAASAPSGTAQDAAGFEPAALGTLALDGEGMRWPKQPARPALIPGKEELQSAAAYAGSREGVVSFAVIDSRGELRGRAENRLYSAASVVKAMLLAAELRRLAAEGEQIDPATDASLSAMIRYSDNEAADAIYLRVGDAGLHAVAARAGMTRFTIAGYWGNAQVTAGDMARFFGDLDAMLPREHREYGQSLLGSVIESQSWGIPVAAGERWAVRFKGGWLPEKALVHQAGELRERGGARELAMAILTDGQPSHDYGIETVEGVAARLLGG